MTARHSLPAVLALGLFAGCAGNSVELSQLGRYVAPAEFDDGAAEITAYDPANFRVFVINSADATVDVLDITDPESPTLLDTIDASAFGAGANSVAVRDGMVAVAIENEDAQDNGVVAFYDADDFSALSQVTVGALPDMLTFTPDGTKVLVANEGEPNDDVTVNPEGSVSIIDVSGGASDLTNDDVTTATFTAFNAGESMANSFASDIRQIFPGATRAEDVEPEYIAVSPDSSTAWVALQEHNALAVLNVNSGEFSSVLYLGEKDHSLEGNELDPSDEDGSYNLAAWPVFGLYQPDAIAAFEDKEGDTYIVTANEGDAVDYDGFSEEARVEDLTLDNTVFTDGSLQDAGVLGRLKTTTTFGDTGVSRIRSYGARSFSIWNDAGQRVFDSGSDFERITQEILGEDFNSTNDENDSGDDRSDDKGPEPEGVAIGEVGRRTFAFIGLERVGGIMVYDITVPAEAEFVEYINNRDFGASQAELEAGEGGDLGPEGLTFISADDSPTGDALLVVGNEITGTTTIYLVDRVRR